ncbi:hypothetical protein Lalb_Chr14g0369221 [Lupinus albus]|uniref:Uncharacterized protein n=1 Tax=Lupinus albus TaxID=3870 RepID=A0A6A4PF64_LUPAL|nr:hypothetical protein Lalb_Chr14g0369221 [Lupinus albus]
MLICTFQVAVSMAVSVSVVVCAVLFINISVSSVKIVHQLVVHYGMYLCKDMTCLAGD